MSLLHCESGDIVYTNNNIESGWTEVSVETFNDNIGSPALDCVRLGNDGLGLAYDFPDDESDTVIVGFRVYPAGTEVAGAVGDDAWLKFYGNGGATRHVSIWAFEGEIRVYRNAPQNTLIAQSNTLDIPANTWSYLEAKVTIDDTVGAVEVRVNGATVLNATGLDTRNGGTDALIDRVAFGRGENINLYGRDFVVMNDAGSAFNDFIGPVIVRAHVPDGAGNYSAWTPNVGTNWEAVDDDPQNDQDTTYVESTASGDRDSYTVEDVNSGAGFGDPLAVVGKAMIRYDAAPLDAGLFIRRGGTDDDGALHTPSTTYAMVKEVWEEDPIAAGAWTEANFNATEFGIRSST